MARLKRFLLAILSHCYIYIIIFAIIGLVTLQPFHFPYRFMHMVESLLLSFILGILVIGIILLAISKWVKPD
ncbi:hypothetical protein L9G16_10985 [Shewanella sp. A25]|nr:hypothetical protein [Shewanella shenzhenensis]